MKMFKEPNSTCEQLNKEQDTSYIQRPSLYPKVINLAVNANKCLWLPKRKGDNQAKEPIFIAEINIFEDNVSREVKIETGIGWKKANKAYSLLVE